MDQGEPKRMRDRPSAGRVQAAAALLVTLPLLVHGQSDRPRPGDAELLQPADLVHLGAFTVPDGFGYSGMGLAFNATNHSLFIAGGRQTAEISIPEIGDRAAFLQPLTDPFEDRLDEIGDGDQRVGGHLVHANRLYLSAYIYYDAGGEQERSHFSRPLDLGVRGEVTGPVEAGSMGAGFYSGYMAPVPAEYQKALGGPAVTGNCCLSIISRTSFGPALFSFDPERPRSARPLVYYPEDHQELGEYGARGANPVFNGTTRIGGVAIPEGWNSVLFFGSTGTGDYCYGSAEECDDPVNPYQGEHAFPYHAMVWAYRLSDLAAVRAGRRPWQVRPYATWTLDFENVKHEFGIGGVAWDPASRRLYVSQRCGEDPEGACGPLIHVFELRRPAS